MSQETEQKVAETRRDNLFRVSPLNVSIREGFNVRQGYPKEEFAQLKEQIRTQGVLDAILASRDPKDRDKFLLNASGHNRLKAALELIAEGNGEKVETIPLILQRTFDELKATAEILSTNTQVSLSLFEKGIAFARIERLLAEKTGGKVKISDVCVAAGLPKNAQTNTMVGSALRLVKLSEESEYMAKTLGKRQISETQVLDMIRKDLSVEQIEKKTEKAIEKAKEAGRETATGKDTGATVTPLQKLASAIEGLEEAGHSCPRLNSAKAILEALSLKKGCTVEVLMKAISPSVEFEDEKQTP